MDGDKILCAGCYKYIEEEIILPPGIKPGDVDIYHNECFVPMEVFDAN